MTEIKDQIAVVKELLFRRMENLYIPYTLTFDDWQFIEEYARKYSFYYENGNDTTTVIGTTQIFREIVSIFDRKAQLHWVNST